MIEGAAITIAAFLCWALQPVCGAPVSYWLWGAEAAVWSFGAWLAAAMFAACKSG